MYGDGGTSKEISDGIYDHKCMMCGKKYKDSKYSYYFAICPTCKRGKDYDEGCHDTYEVLR